MLNKALIGLSGLIAIGLLLSFAMVPAPLMAATPSDGSDPARAINLSVGETDGQLDAGQVLWYVYQPALGQAPLETLTFIFTPAVGTQLPGINFEIFSAGQVNSGQDITVLPAIGAGSEVSRDGDGSTAEFLWQGNLPGPGAYYLRVFNETSTDVDYWLFTDDVITPQLGPVPASTAVQDVQPGAIPGTPLAVRSDEMFSGQMDAGQEWWYLISAPDYGYDQGDTDHDLTLFFTPGGELNADHVGFEIMTPEQLLFKQRGSIHLNTGAGSVVSRDDDPLTGERLWSGQLMEDHVYLVRVFNGSENPVDFWMYQDDRVRPYYGQAPLQVSQAVAVPAGSDYSHPLALSEGLNQGSLEPGEARYYSFGWTNFPQLSFGPLYLTMFYTPDDGNYSNRVGFDMVSARDIHLWARGDADQINPFGGGSRVSRDGDDLTGEKLWAGWLFNAGPYYVKVYNDSDQVVDYWLYTQDLDNVRLDLTPALEEADEDESREAALVSESGALAWNSWHVSLTCSTHCNGS